MSTPSNYTSMPIFSVLQKSEAEIVARNIMIILKRTGNVWRNLSWDEYREERIKDGQFTMGEETYYNMVIGHCQSPETANLFCKNWHKKY